MSYSSMSLFHASPSPSLSQDPHASTCACTSSPAAVSLSISIDAIPYCVTAPPGESSWRRTMSPGLAAARMELIAIRRSCSLLTLLSGWNSKTKHVGPDCCDGPAVRRSKKRLLSSLVM